MLNIHISDIRTEDYIKGLISKKYKLREVSVYTGYTIQQLSRLKKRYEKEGSKALINGHKGKKVNKRYFSKKEKTNY